MCYYFCNTPSFFLISSPPTFITLFAKLFENRFCIMTPKNNDHNSIDQIIKFWNSLGMEVQSMEAEHHDRVLAMTSHIPQLIAYSVVTTSTELEAAADVIAWKSPVKCKLISSIGTTWA